MPKRNKHAVGKRKRQNQREHDDQFAKRQRTTHFGERDDHFLRRDAITAAHPQEFIKSQLRIIQIPNDAVGFVIGKGGGTIKYLRCESGAEIHVTSDIESDLFSVERDVKLRGSARSIAKAQQLIKDLLDKHEFIKSQLRIIQIPNDMAGFVIGKGGKTIKYLELESGANIQVTTGNDSDPSALVRDIKLRGSAVSIAKAEMLIRDLLAKAGSRDSVGVGQSVSQPKLSITLIGDFKIYKRLKYHRPFRVLVDTLFLKGFLLEEANSVEAIQSLLGGRIIISFTNCVHRNFGQKHLEMPPGVATEMYPCRDDVNDLRKDFDCIKHFLNEDGIKERLILATGNKELKRLMNKYSPVPILYFHDSEVQDKEVARELLLLGYYQNRNEDLDNRVSEATECRETVNVLVDEGFIRLALQCYKSEELIGGRMKVIGDRISELVGDQVDLCVTRCTNEKSSAYFKTLVVCGCTDAQLGMGRKVATNSQLPTEPQLASGECISKIVVCGHRNPIPTSDNCILSVVEEAKFAVHFVATTSERLKIELSKIHLLTVISIEEMKIILNKPKATMEIAEFPNEETWKRGKKVQLDANVVDTVDGRDNDDDLAWLDPPPKLVVNKQKRLESSTIKELRI